MTRITCLLITLLYLVSTCAQKPAVSSEQLSSKQIGEVFPDDLRKKLGITFPIFKVYKYDDKSGQFYCVLTESRTSITEENDGLAEPMIIYGSAVTMAALNSSFTTKDKK